MLSRRSFFRISVLSFLSVITQRCLPTKKKKNTKVTFRKSPAERGHQLREQTTSFSEGQNIYRKVVIIGGGISGLSAAYHLKKRGLNDILILELDEQYGGNSAYGSNPHSEYPYGAHYLSLPNPDNQPLISFLLDKGIITGFDSSGQAVFNETDLCFDPEERLLIRGTFQDGLVPNYGVSPQEKQEINRFFDLVEKFRRKKGEDGQYFFNIPRRLCSNDPELDPLDTLFFKDFLTENGFNSPYLLWYLNYCCRDDFGGGLDKVSAWAGINYFASHRPQPSNTDSARVLTWPEGNGRLVKLISSDLIEKIQTGCLVKHIRMNDNGIQVEYLDFNQKESVKINCDYCVAAIPPFILSRILDKHISYPFDHVSSLQHTPWMVAAVTLTHIPEGRGSVTCWDNVAYGTASLGYIHNQHQHLKQVTGKPVISIYINYDQLPAQKTRKEIQKYSIQQWEEIITSELELIHPGISEAIEEIEVCVWGHGMILPSPGLSRGRLLKDLSRPLGNRLFFAHSDLAAYSTFEEAFDQGYQAAEKINTLLS